MGAENGGDDEKPTHLVRISRPFYLGKYPVTQAQWAAVMGTNPSHFTGDPSLPVEEEFEDPRQELVNQLLEYEKFKMNDVDSLTQTTAGVDFRF